LFNRMQPESVLAKRSFASRSNDLAARDFSSRLSRFLRDQLHKCCAAGTLLSNDPRVWRAWRRHWNGPHYLQLLRWRDEGFQPRVVYDIGANDGLWSEMCQEVFNPSHCLLFEPQSELGQHAIARQPQGAHWQLLSVALGDREQHQELHVTRSAAASSLLRPVASEVSEIPELEALRTEKVSVSPLDALVESRGLPAPDLVKIDVQGFEGHVLAGGPKTIGRARRLVVETSLQPLYEGQSLLPEVLSTLAGWGFEVDDVQEAFRKWPGPLRQVDLWLRQRE
jgi:FkbM family methyltransferase